MKIFRLMQVMTVFFSTVWPSSCIENEPLNAECDIVPASQPEELLVRPAEIVDRKDVHSVTFIVKILDVTALAPEFEITPGARSTLRAARCATSPIRRSIQSHPKTGQWSKTYTVIAKHDDPIALKYSFENARVVPANSQGGMG